MGIRDSNPYIALFRSLAYKATALPVKLIPKTQSISTHLTNNYSTPKHCKLVCVAIFIYLIHSSSLMISVDIDLLVLTRPVLSLNNQTTIMHDGQNQSTDLLLRCCFHNVLENLVHQSSAVNKHISFHLIPFYSINALLLSDSPQLDSNQWLPP